MLYHDSYGITETEIQETAYFIDPQYTHSINSVMFSDFVTNLYVKLGNRIYFKPNTKLNETFANALNDFQGTSKKIAFRDQELMSNDINTWVDEQTRDSGKQFITPEKIQRTMDTLFLSTIFLNTNFKFDYTNETLLTRNFKDFNGHEYLTQFITNNDVYYAVIGDQELKADAVEINLVDDSYMSILIIMPHESSSVREIVNMLTVDYFIDVVTKISKHNLDLTLPLLNFESTIDARKHFIEFGIKSLSSSAEIQMFENRNVTNVSKILHKTKIEFNPRNEDSEPGKVPTKQMFISNIFLNLFIETRQEDTDAPKANLVIDRPFIFMVLVQRNKLPLFIGHFMKP